MKDWGVLDVHVLREEKSNHTFFSWMDIVVVVVVVVEQKYPLLPFMDSIDFPTTQLMALE